MANPIRVSRDWDEMLEIGERHLHDTHLRLLGALVKPTLGFSSEQTRQTGTAELMRSTRPECAGFTIITDEAVALYLQVEEIEARLIDMRLRRARASSGA